MSQRQLSLWGPVAVVAGAIALLSHVPSPSTPAGTPDWLLHALEYGVLGFVLARACAGGLSRGRLGLGPLGLTLVLGTLYGVSDEWHQSWVPGRDASARDVLADMVGSGLGLGLAAGVAAALHSRGSITTEKLQQPAGGEDLPAARRRKI